VQKPASALLWKLADLLPRRLAQTLCESRGSLGQTGERTVAARQPWIWAALPSYVLRVALRQARAILARRWATDRWCVLLGQGDDLLSTIREGNFKQLAAPPDRLWADPFVIRRDGGSFVYLEEMEYRSMRGHILCLRLNEQFEIAERRIVVAEAFHLSYPYLFSWEGTLFMIPESADNRTVELYKCTAFPWEWRRERTLLSGGTFIDNTLFRHEEQWWLFSVVQAIPGAPVTDELHLHYARFLEGPWSAHPLNPVVSDARKARPAGRLFFDGGNLIRPAQNCAGGYGRNIVLNRVTRLSETDYAEESMEDVRIPPGYKTMHHVDFSCGLAVLDATTSANGVDIHSSHG